MYWPTGQLDFKFVFQVRYDFDPICLAVLPKYGTKLAHAHLLHIKYVNFSKFHFKVIRAINKTIINIAYLTIRRQARGFYRLIVGEGRSPEPTIKGDRNRERAV